jgi:hypothetical protein
MAFLAGFVVGVLVTGSVLFVLAVAVDDDDYREGER